MTYNGWTNYETWAVGMFLDGNYTGEGTYRDVLELTRNAIDALGSDADSLDAHYSLAALLREYTEEACDATLSEPSIASDLLSAALSEVNWDELAESKLEEVAEHA